jgi:hypothetical protein
LRLWFHSVFARWQNETVESSPAMVALSLNLSRSVGGQQQARDPVHDMAVAEKQSPPKIRKQTETPVTHRHDHGHAMTLIAGPSNIKVSPDNTHTAR